MKINEKNYTINHFLSCDNFIEVNSKIHNFTGFPLQYWINLGSPSKLEEDHLKKEVELEEKKPPPPTQEEEPPPAPPEEIEVVEDDKEINKKAIFNLNKKEGNEGNASGDGDMGVGDGEGFGYRLSTIENYRSKLKGTLDHQLGMGEGYITIDVIVNAEGKIIDIDDNSIETNLGYIGKTKRKKLYKAIKRDLKYGPVTGNDKSDKIEELKIIFTN